MAAQPMVVQTDVEVSWPPGSLAQFVRHGTVVQIDPSSAMGAAYGGPSNLAALPASQTGDGTDADHAELGN